MLSPDDVIKVEIQAQESFNIRNIFSKCGEILSIVPCRTVSSDAHFFIKFRDDQSLQRALDLANTGIRVYTVASDPNLVGQFRAAYNRHQLQKINIPHLLWQLSDTPKKGVSNQRENIATPRTENTSHDSLISQNSTSRSSFALSGGILEPNSFQALISPEAWRSLHSSTDIRDEFRSKRTTSNVLSLLSLTPDAHQRFALADAKKQNEILPRLCGQLLLHFSGEEITYDLQALEPDPRFIIELLKITRSERGNYMIVAAYYRRVGNSKAAVTVTKSMIEAMKLYGVSDNELKPAFLLLSGCEIDLAKHARSNGEYKQGDEHQKHSRMWLHKVYGDHNIINSSPAATQVEIERIPPLKPVSNTLLQQDLRSNIVSTTSEIGTLEQEIQSLRSRRKKQSDLLLEMHVEKRKLEEDLMIERQFRHKIQRRLNEVDKELHTARKMEMYALDQVKREVDARRRAEESARAEKTLRLDLSRILESGSFHPSLNEAPDSPTKMSPLLNAPPK